MSRYPNLSFEKVRKLLKLSKSAPADNGPYSIVQEEAWFTVFDKNQTAVGQCAGQYSEEEF